MNAPYAAPAGADSSSTEEIKRFRQRASENGYRLIRVRTASKQPLSSGWQQGERPDLLRNVCDAARNTGLLLAGLRCIDLDVDDPELVAKIVDVARQHLPSGALVRRRGNSPRLALLFRAAIGSPGKRTLAGSKGKVEILGAGQHVVVQGIHPSGAAILWMNGRGPDTVPAAQVPSVSEEQIGAFLNASAPILGAERRFETAPLSAASPKLPPSGNELSSGVERPRWFEALDTADKDSVVEECLAVLANQVDDPRDRWLRVVFAAADAERLGSTRTHDLTLAWSRRGASWTSEDDFEKAWQSYKPGAVGVGTLLSLGHAAGVDLSRWRNTALAHLTRRPAPTSPVTSLLSVPTTQLPSIPPKREWLHGTDVVRGSVSLLVSPGARGKSSWLIMLALACASGQSLLGAHVFGGPLRVLLLSAEDSTSEVTLRLRAAMTHHRLQDADVPRLSIIGAKKWQKSLLRAGNVPSLDANSWQKLEAEIVGTEPDVLILDPLIALMGGVDGNNNSAAALLMGGFVSLATRWRAGIVVAHHASKGRDPMSAESAMGAASFVNLSRIALGIEPLSEKDAGRVGVPPWEARSIFRIVGTKQNLSPPDSADRWYRLISVQVPNQNPPVYPTGDKVAVVEPFQPGISGPAFPHAIIRAALAAIDKASPPLSPSRRATGRYAAPIIAQAIAPHSGGQTSDSEAAAVLDHLIRAGLAVVQPVTLPRAKGRADVRNGLVLTPAGQMVVQQANPIPQPVPQSPHSPASTNAGNTGAAPHGAPQRQGGAGETRGSTKTTVSTELCRHEE